MRTDNLDLAMQRRRYRITQTDLATALKCSVPPISKFENGQRELPNGLTREDYQRALDELVRERLSGTPA